MKGKNQKLATLFFLPLEDRPKEFSPLVDFKGKFWHTGIILEDEKKIYECFNKGKNNVSDFDNLKNQRFTSAIFLKDIPIDQNKLVSEITSGTDCAEYVARCTGLSELEGENKGNLYPEEVYNLLLNKE